MCCDQPGSMMACHINNSELCVWSSDWSMCCDQPGSMMACHINTSELCVWSNDWTMCCDQPGSMMACHINWHSAIYHVEKANYDTALEIFDTAVSSHFHSDIYH